MTEAAAAAGAVSRESLDARLGTSPGWLADRRNAAWDAFTAMPAPSSARDEDWRRTDIGRLHPDRFTPIDSVARAGRRAMRAQRDQPRPTAAFIIDSPVANPIEGAETLLAQGVIVSSLEEAALVTRSWSSAPSRGSCGRLQLRGALECALAGRRLRVRPPGCQAHARLGHPPGGRDRPRVFPSTVVVLDEGSALTVIDAYASPTGPAALLSDAMVILSAARDARLDYDTVQQWGEGVWHIALQRATLDANAKLRFMGVTLGARLQKA